MRDRQSAQPVAAVVATLAVCVAAALPLLSTLNAYFIGDDYGLIQLFSAQPTFHFLTLFTRPWTETIYGPPSDELRPFVELSYQLDSLWGPGNPFGYHLDNIALHVLNAVLVLAIARGLCRLGWPAATFAGMVFALLPVQAEVGAWISGRADSLPALFFLLALLAFGLWRRTGAEREAIRSVEGGANAPPGEEGPKRRASHTIWLYGVSLVACFLALFSKQSAIMILPALISYDSLITRRVPWRPWRTLLAYLPFCLLTVGYLGLRHVLFGDVVRESHIDRNTFVSLALVQATYLHMLATGSLVLRTALVPQIATFVGLAVSLLVGVMALPAIVRGSAPRRLGAAFYFGPVWWLITVAPLAVTYVSGRHLYLTAAGFAIVLGIGFEMLVATRAVTWRALVVVAGAGLLAFYAMNLHSAVEEWNRSAARADRMLHDVWREAAAAPEGSLIIVEAPPANAPVTSWRGTSVFAFSDDAKGPDLAAWTWILSYAAPFMYQPPFAPSDLTARVAFLEPSRVYCCLSNLWFQHTHDTLRRWYAHGENTSVVTLTWDTSGALVRREDDPQLRAALVDILKAPDEAPVLLNGIFR
ncbi:MAG: protein O-mannosyl-transferase [Chloroflexota bacterium]|jgi:hypothetical protein|nr:protein O-mannosyl-transferase [Chloroflexota bacterium]